MGKVVIDRKKIIILIIFWCIIFFSLKYCSNLYTIYILDDEFGYWANAAWLIGYDWKSAMQNVSYYGVGYSFILAPILAFFNDPVLVYRIAVIINSLMLGCIFIIIQHVLKAILKEENEFIKWGIAVSLTMYSGYLLYTNFSWPEILISLLSWAVIYLVILTVKTNHSNKHIFLFALCTGYLYIIHQRLLGLVVSSIIFIVVLFKFKKITRKELVLFLTTLLVMLILQAFLKNIIQNDLYVMSSATQKNDFSGQLVKIRLLTSPEGIKRIINVAVSQFFYVGISSCFLAYIGLYEIYQGIRYSIKTRKFGDFHFLLYFFVLLVYIFLQAISVLSLIKYSRIDHLAYGRYTGNWIMPLTMLGLYHIVRTPKKKVFCEMIFVICLGAGLGVIFQKILADSGLKSFVPINAPVLFNYITQYIENETNILSSRMFITAITALALSVLFLKMFRRGRVLAFIVLISAFAFPVLSVMSQKVVPEQEYNKGILSISEKVRQYDLPVYFLMQGDWGTDNVKDFFQFQLKDKVIECVTKQQLNGDAEDEYLVITTQKNPLESRPGESYELICVDHNYRLWKYVVGLKNNSLLKEYSVDLTEFSGNGIWTDNKIESSGKEGHMIYGPYYQLNRGIYEVGITYENLNREGVKRFEVVQNGKVIAEKDLKKDIGVLNDTIFFELPSDADGIEFRLFTDEKQQLSVIQIKLKEI